MAFQIAVKQKTDYSKKLVKASDIEKYRDAGYHVMDMHLHTSVSPDVIPAPGVLPRNLYKNMTDENWDFVTFTDHDTLAAYDDFGPLPKNIIRGVEIKIKPKRIGNYIDAHTLHINVFCLNDRQFEDLEDIAATGQFYEFKNYLEYDDLPYQLNHPTWCEFSDKPDWRYLPDVINEFDVIEVFNYKRSLKHNYIALKLLAEEHGKGITAGSDSHTGEPIKATLFKGDDFRESWERIKAGETFVLEQDENNTLDKQELLKTLAHLQQVERADLERDGICYNLGPLTDRLVRNLISMYIRSPRWVIKSQEAMLRTIFSLGGDYILKKIYLEKDDKSANHIYRLFREEIESASLNDKILSFG